MKIVITGHTQGIGKAIFEKYGGIGLSRSTGFDITKDNILPFIDKDTVFINNAYTSILPHAQTMLLLDTYNVAKHVICIGSNTIYNGVYKDAKDHLANTVTELFYEGYNVTNVKLGKVDTPFQNEYHRDKISLNTVINTIEFILATRERIHEISIRPTKE
jgi:hypothetical protein|tara:strand:+ start:958 stop:1437 length:480 start_codon:yes stop_codon:yes gene_type:complete